MAHILEIGNCAYESSVCVHFPPASVWRAEFVGGETEDGAGEFCVQEKSSDIKDRLGVRTSPCAFPIRINALGVPSPSSTRRPDFELACCVGSDGKETTRRATRCANACDYLCSLALAALRC